MCAAHLPPSVFALGSAFVCVQGPPGCLHSARLEGLISKTGVLRANTGSVVDWLSALRFVNNCYQDTAVAELEEAYAEVKRVRGELIRTKRTTSTRTRRKRLGTLSS